VILYAAVETLAGTDMLIDGMLLVTVAPAIGIEDVSDASE
jgi:hypothetical protein